jgi:hypothetical protein
MGKVNGTLSDATRVSPGYGAGFRLLFHKDDMGASSRLPALPAPSYLTGDFTGAGTTEIVQLWDNNGQLGMILYGSDGNRGLEQLFHKDDMGASSRVSLAYLTGDFTGAGRTEIVQLWDNNGQLGMILYGSDGNRGLELLFHKDDMGASSRVPASPTPYLTGDFTGAGTTEIVQLWDNNGQLGMILYGSDGNRGLRQLFPRNDMGASSRVSLAYLTGDFTGTWTTEIVQLWDNNGQLGMILYGRGEKPLIRVTKMLDSGSTGSIEAPNSTFLALNADGSLSANPTSQAAPASLVFTISGQALYIQCNSKYLKAGRDGSLKPIADSTATGTPFYVLLTEGGDVLLSTTDRRLWQLGDDLKITVALTGRIDLCNEFTLNLHPEQTHSLLARHGLQAMDNPAACELAWAGFAWQLTGGMFLALGLGPFIINDGEVNTGILALLRSKPAVLDSLQKAYNKFVEHDPKVAAVVVTASALDLIANLWSAGLLWDVVKLTLSLAGWWVAFKVLANILELVLAPEVEAAELLASFATWLGQTVYRAVILKKECGY